MSTTNPKGDNEMTEPTPDPFPWGDVFDAPAPAEDGTLEMGRQLASDRDDLIAAGADPAELDVPVAPELSEEERATVDRFDAAPPADLADEIPPEAVERLVEATREAATPSAEPVQWIGIEGVEAALDNLADLATRQATIRPAIDTVVDAVRKRAAKRAETRPAKVKTSADLRRELVGVTRDGDVLSELARVFTAGANETKAVVGDLMDELPTRDDKPRMSAKVADGDGFELKITRSKRTEVKTDDEVIDDVLAAFLVSAAEARHKRADDDSEVGDPLAMGKMPTVTYAAGVRAGIAALRNVLSASPGYRSTALDALVKVMQSVEEDELAKRLASAYGRVQKGEATIKLDRVPLKPAEAAVLEEVATDE